MEYDKLLPTQYPSAEIIRTSILDAVFGITQGHRDVGATCDVMNIILGYNVCAFVFERSVNLTSSSSHVVNSSSPGNFTLGSYFRK
jgi:hypothetical protein